jgi:glycosyltransferase involved in cell wall biosynthesis
MKILMVHNRYQIAGGEDSVVDAEVALLRQSGHEVVMHHANNDGIKGPLRKFSAALSATYSSIAKRELAVVLDRERPDVAHVHNFFPVLSPSIYDACAQARIPVVQTLHNYRTICPGALLMRDQKVCELCVTGSPYQAVKYGCYRESKLGTLAVARMVATHRKRRTWSTKIQRIIALTAFARAKFGEAGFDTDRIAIKPNFIADPIEDGDLGAHDQGALFVGRISVEKGVDVMIDAWRDQELPLRIAGDGPRYDELRTSALPDSVGFLGRQTKNQVYQAMRQARFMVMPSVWYEGFPMVIVEAFAHGLPVVCSRLGGMAEVVEDGVSGLHFEPGNPEDLAAKVQVLIDDPERCRAMGRAARDQFLAAYGPEQNIAHLERIYRDAAQAL